MTELALALRFDRSELSADPVLRRFVRAPLRHTPPEGLRLDVLAAARANWVERTRAEYIGVMLVRHFHGLLVDLNAPADVQELALTMLLHEQQHALLCAEAARSLGADPEVSFDLAELQIQRPRQRPLDELLWDAILGTYVCGEVVALSLLRHTLRALPPSSYRSVLASIYRDEVLHARIGPALLGKLRSGAPPRWLPYPGDDAVLRRVRQFREGMRARDVVEAEEAALFADPEAAAQLLSVGVPPSAPFRQAYLRGVDGAISRGLASVFGAAGQ